jgi:hypothetical protein
MLNKASNNGTKSLDVSSIICKVVVSVSVANLVF